MQLQDTLTTTSAEVPPNKMNVRSTGAMKEDHGKLRFSLLPVQPLRDIVLVLMFGAQKYGDYNWQKGFPWTDIYDATQRHLEDWLDPNEPDEAEDSGLNHLAHAACNLFFLLVFRFTHPELDNRFKNDNKKSIEKIK